MVLVFYNFVYLYFVYIDNNMSLNVIDERYGRPQQCQHYVLPSWGFVNVCILRLDLWKCPTDTSEYVISEFMKLCL